jgi:hypothetical protein
VASSPSSLTGGCPSSCRANCSTWSNVYSGAGTKGLTVPGDRRGTRPSLAVRQQQQQQQQQRQAARAVVEGMAVGARRRGGAMRGG